MCALGCCSCTAHSQLAALIGFALCLAPAHPSAFWCRWCCDWDDGKPGLETKSVLDLEATDGPTGFIEFAPAGRQVKEGGGHLKHLDDLICTLLLISTTWHPIHLHPRSWMARFGLAGHTSFLEPGSIVFGGITCECCPAQAAELCTAAMANRRSGAGLQPRLALAHPALQPRPPAPNVYNMLPWVTHTQARLRWTTATSSPTQWPWPPPFTSPACVATGQRVGMGERCFEDCCEDAPCMCLPGPAALTRRVLRCRLVASMPWHSKPAHVALPSFCRSAEDLAFAWAQSRPAAHLTLELQGAARAVA